MASYYDRLGAGFFLAIVLGALLLTIPAFRQAMAVLLIPLAAVVIIWAALTAFFGYPSFWSLLR